MKNAISMGPIAPDSPFSPAVATGNQLYVSGQLPVDAKGELVEGVAAQTAQCMDNLKALVEKAGFEMSDVVKTTVYMTDFTRFAEMSRVYSTYFSGVKPARCACEVTALARGAIVEIDCIAVKQ